MFMLNSNKPIKVAYDDFLTKVTDLYHLSIKRTEGGGGNPPLSLTRKVKYTP